MIECFHELSPVLEQVPLVPGLTTQPTVASQQCYKCQICVSETTDYYLLGPWALGFLPNSRKRRGHPIWTPCLPNCSFLFGF